MTTRTFSTTDTTLRDRNGQSVEVIGVIRRPDADHDAEVLPMYRIRFPDGETAEAWRDEIVAPQHGPAVASWPGYTPQAQAYELATRRPR